MQTRTSDARSFALSALFALTLAATVSAGDGPVTSWSVENLAGAVVADASGLGQLGAAAVAED